MIDQLHELDAYLGTVEYGTPDGNFFVLWNFPVGSSDLQPAHRDGLAKFASDLCAKHGDAWPQMILHVQGSASAEGDELANAQLGEARATATAAYLNELAYELCGGSIHVTVSSVGEQGDEGDRERYPRYRMAAVQWLRYDEIPATEFADVEPFVGDQGDWIRLVSDVRAGNDTGLDDEAKCILRLIVEPWAYQLNDPHSVNANWVDGAGMKKVFEMASDYDGTWYWPHANLVGEDHTGNLITTLNDKIAAGADYWQLVATINNAIRAIKEADETFNRLVGTGTTRSRSVGDPLTGAKASWVDTLINHYYDTLRNNADTIWHCALH